MRKSYLIEDKLPPKLPVIFSAKISKRINAIYAKNQDNIEAISQWDKYIDGIKGYISNPVIALDYTNRFQRLPRGGRFIRDFDYNVGYTIITNNTTNQPCVYVFMINLKPKEFGLREEKRNNNSIDRIITETINNYLKRNLLLVS